MERRYTQRIALDVPVQTGTGTGTLRDISGSGAYFIASGSYQVGGAVRFSLELKHAVPKQPLRLIFLGRVTRMDQFGDKIGVAATIDRYNCLQ